MASLQAMWDLSSSTKDQTCGPCNESADSKPLDLQESPQSLSYIDISLLSHPDCVNFDEYLCGGFSGYGSTNWEFQFFAS